MASFNSIWNSILRIGHRPDMDDMEQTRLQTSNGFMAIVIAIVIPYSLVFFILGSAAALEGLLVVPFLSVLFFLNYKGHIKTSRYLLVYGFIVLLTGLAISDRRTGTEYTIIAIGCCSVLIFENLYHTIFAFVFAFLNYLLYSWYDSTHPFIPDPNLPYIVAQNTLMFLSGFIVVAQALVFRNSIKRFSENLKIANEEINSINEELKITNEQLMDFMENLDSIVKKKNAELKAYTEAIDFNTCSAIIALDGSLLKVNEPLAEVSGYSIEELTNKSFKMILPDNSREKLTEDFQIMNKSGNTWCGELKIKHKVAGYNWVDCVIIPIRNDDGQIHEYLFIGFPITERKENQQMRDNTLALLESIAFKTSHEIRGPIANIDGLAMLVRLNMVTEDEFPMIAGMFSSANNDLRSATSDLVKFVNARRNDYVKE